MPKVQIKKNEIYVGAKAVPLVSGEVHYWRLNPSYWKEILSRVREMGLKAVSTYIPWDYHEYTQGKFDFTGKTDQTRNLKAFLDLTKKEKFYVIIRPGPYIYSEWPNEGAPDYAFKYHRLHPKFQEYAERYVRNVVKILNPYFADRPGGNILMLQADNEIDPWPDLFGYQYGLQKTPGLFQDYIKELYEGNLRALNDSWGTDYSSFDEAGPFIATMLAGETGLALKGDKELKRNLDYLSFKHDYSRRCAQWAVGLYRKLGVKVPIYLNLYPFFYAHDWAQMQSTCDMVGVDFYPSNELAEDGYEQRKFMDKIRYLSSVSTIPYIAEFASGIWHAKHYEMGAITPNHYRLLTLSALLAGIKGWNWYMLVNRDNWYMSPINEWGRVRGELYDVFKKLVEIFNEIHPPSLNSLRDVAVTFNPMQYAARTLSHNSPVLVALYDSDVDYDLWNPENGECTKKFLFYSGNQWLSPGAHRNLKKFVEGGGTLIAFRDFPRKDDHFNLISTIGFEEPACTLFEFKKRFGVKLAPGRRVVEMVSSVYSFEKLEEGAQPIVADFGDYGKITIGYIKNVGEGSIIHLGVDPTREMVMEILDFLKVPLTVYSPTKDIKTALFQRGNAYYLIVTNNGDEEKSASIYMPALEHFHSRMLVHDYMAGTTTHYSAERRAPFSCEIPRKDGKVFEFKL